MRIRRLALPLTLIIIAACSSSESNETPDAGCVMAYETAGCGVAPVCHPAGVAEDACADTFCGCDGLTFQGACGYATKPFAHVGVCEAGDSGPHPDADATGDADAATSDADASTIDSSTTDSGPADADAATNDGCAGVWAYTAPGCSATPTCHASGPEDACASTFCGCDGKTFYGACGYSTKPYASAGACPDAGVDGG
jgi:hypothetical protein